MIMSAYFIAALGAAVPAVIRFSAATLRKCGNALFAAMKASREREVARQLARYRHLIADPDSLGATERTWIPDVDIQGAAADRRDELLALGQAVPFQSAARLHHAPRVGGRSSGGTLQGAQ